MCMQAPLESSVLSGTRHTRLHFAYACCSMRSSWGPDTGTAGRHVAAGRDTLVALGLQHWGSWRRESPGPGKPVEPLNRQYFHHAGLQPRQPQATMRVTMATAALLACLLALSSSLAAAQSAPMPPPPSLALP